jgi:cohesin loading factor subunit SCC2
MLPTGPSADVLEGLSAMYSDIVQSTQGVRQRFLTALLKPFDASCNLAASQSAAAREDPSRLAFCAYLAANLPFKKADEPLVLLHVINGYVSRLAQEVRDQLRRALLSVGLQQAMGLDDEEEEDIPPAPAQQHHQEAPAAGGVSGTPATAASEQQNGSAPQQQQAHHTVALPLPLPLPQWLAAPLKASLGLSMLLVLKQYLMAAYALSDERVAQYELKGEKARAEAKVVVGRSKKLEAFGLNVVNLRAVLDGTGDLWAAQYKTFAGLLDNDAANYK